MSMSYCPPVGWPKFETIWDTPGSSAVGSDQKMQQGLRSGIKSSKIFRNIDGKTRYTVNYIAGQPDKKLIKSDHIEYLVRDMPFYVS